MDSKSTSYDHLEAGSRRPSRKMSQTSIFSSSIVCPEMVLSDCVNSTQDLSSMVPDKEKPFKAYVPEFIAGCSATSFHVIVGVTFAATSALLPQLENPDSDIVTTKSETAWIASIFVIVVPFASIFSSFIMERFGRLNAVKLSILPSIASSALIALATNVPMVVGGRFLMGIGAEFAWMIKFAVVSYNTPTASNEVCVLLVALGTSPAVVYITEITSPRYRGSLVSAGPTLSSLGMLLGYLVGALLPWRIVSWINIAYCIVPLILIVILFVPESPDWLMSKAVLEKNAAKKATGKSSVKHEKLATAHEARARASLEWLAKWEDPGSKLKTVERKLAELRNYHDSKMTENTSWASRLSGFKKPSGYKPLIIMIILFSFQQYTGVYITTFYAVQFFEEAKSSINPFYAAVLVGLIRFVMSVATIFLLKWVGRRPLCMVSCLGMAVSMAVSGYYTRQSVISDEPSIVPVVCILIYVCFSLFGMLSLPWTMAAEVFPTQIRSLAHGLVIASAHVVMFISVQSYFSMAQFFGGHDGLQWFFSVMSVLALVFVYFFLPETRNLTLQEIEEYFYKHTIYAKDEEPTNNNYETNIKLDSSKQLDRKFSARNVEILESLPENCNEYDSLVKQNQGRYPTILPKQQGNRTKSVGENYDVEFIDKSNVNLDQLQNTNES